MGCRHVTCVYANGQFAFVHVCLHEGYPAVMGLEVLNFLTPENIDDLRDGLEFVKILSEEEARNSGLHKTAGVGILEDLAEAGSQPESGKRVETSMDLEFANDGMFCEWAYVVNLDAKVLQVYRGLESEEAVDSNPEKNLFAKVGVTRQELKATFAFDKLPERDEFVLVCEIGEGE